MGLINFDNMKNIFVILFIFCTNSLFAQRYKLSEGKGLNYNGLDYIDCWLCLSENKYIMELSRVAGDIVFTTFPSYGYVRKEGNLYYLKDIPTNTEIVLEKDKFANLNIKKGFSFMQKKSFTYEDEAEHDDFSLFDIDVKYAQKKKAVQSIKEKQIPDKLKFKFGEYVNRYVHVFIEENASYTIAYKYFEYLIVISEGKWSTKDGILKLRDSFLDYSFTMLPGEDGKLIAIDFPNDVNEGWVYSFEEERNKYKKIKLE